MLQLEGNLPNKKEGEEQRWSPGSGNFQVGCDYHSSEAAIGIFTPLHQVGGVTIKKVWPSSPKAIMRAVRVALVHLISP